MYTTFHHPQGNGNPSRAHFALIRSPFCSKPGDNDRRCNYKNPNAFFLNQALIKT
jgi:hypothetical protein